MQVENMKISVTVMKSVVEKCDTSQCFIDHTKSNTDTILRPFKSLENSTNINKPLLFYRHSSSECSQC